MIYLGDGWQPDEEYPPMNGTRVGHEIVDEDVMLLKVEYAEQTFNGDRRSLLMVEPLRGEPEVGSDKWDKCMDWVHKTVGNRPLTRSYI